MLRTDHHDLYNSLPIAIETYTFDRNAGILPEFSRLLVPQNNRHFAFHDHNHEDPEFIFVREGVLYVSLNDMKYELSAGDLLIVNPYDIHSGMFDRNERVVYTYMIFAFQLVTDAVSSTAQILGGLTDGSLRLPSVIRASEVTARLGELMLRVESLRGTTLPVSDLDSTAAVLTFMSILLSEFGASENNGLSRDIVFIRRILDLIEKRYAERLSTADAARELGYNESYFCALFKKNFGVSFMGYLNSYRVRRSLAGDPTSLTALAASVGFTNYCHYNRCFRRLTGVPPTEYFADLRKSR